MKRHLSTILILGCALLVAGWQLLALYARRGQEPLQIQAEDFASLALDVPGWQSTKLPVPNDPLAPTIVAYRLTRRADATRLLLRLVHGYNMVDCMRIKHYDVRGKDESGENLKPEGGIDGKGSEANLEPSGFRFSDPSGFLQCWRLSKGDQHSLWITAMLSGGDLAYTGKDTRSMSFPRIGTADAASWNPTGLSWRSLRHPISNSRQALRSHWNASRSDIWVFLRLRRPAWVSDKDLTLVLEGDPRHPLSQSEMTGIIDAAHSSLREGRRQ
jgi:hypothetical protein